MGKMGDLFDIFCLFVVFALKVLFLCLRFVLCQCSVHVVAMQRARCGRGRGWKECGNCRERRGEESKGE